MPLPSITNGLDSPPEAGNSGHERSGVDAGEPAQAPQQGVVERGADRRRRVRGRRQRDRRRDDRRSVEDGVRGQPWPVDEGSPRSVPAARRHSASCAARNMVARMRRRPGELERPPSFSTAMTSVFEAWMAGTSANTSTVTPTRQSARRAPASRSSSRASRASASPGIGAAEHADPANRHEQPERGAGGGDHQRPRPAAGGPAGARLPPTEARIASSRVRSSDRSSIRLATLAHEISTTMKPMVMNASQTGSVGLPRKRSLIGTRAGAGVPVGVRVLAAPDGRRCR